MEYGTGNRTNELYDRQSSQLQYRCITGIQKQIVSPDLLEESSACVAKLKALKIEAITPTFDLEEVSEAYQQLLAEFSKIDC